MVLALWGLYGGGLYLVEDPYIIEISLETTPSVPSQSDLECSLMRI